MTTTTALLPGQPVENGEPVFAKPWQAQAFALAVSLNQQGLFSWREWADALANEISRAQAQGDPDLGDTYYMHWVRALETLVREKRLVTDQEMTGTRKRWRRAFETTPHGQPVSIK